MRIEESFALLLTGELPEGATQLSTRPSGVTTTHGPVLLGVDRSGRRHVLIPLESGSHVTDRISRGITLASRELVVDDETQTFADLACDIPRLAQVFERLVENLIERLEGSTAPMPVIAKTLEEWRALLQQALAEISRETVLGIVGELEILRTLSERSIEAIQCWAGPSGAVHDFVRGGRAIEVKATASVDGNSVRISNLDQLDPGTVPQLHLAVVHLKESADAASIDDRIAQLIELGVPAIELEQALGLLGYVRGMSEAVATRFEVRGIRWWIVADDFPGLRSSDIDPVRLRAVGHVSYDLMLAGTPSPIADDQAEAMLTDWMGA